MHEESMFSFFWIRQCSPDNYPEVKNIEVGFNFTSTRIMSRAGKVYKITGYIHYINIKKEQGDYKKVFSGAWEKYSF